jgi:hypothetical protein
MGRLLGADSPRFSDNGERSWAVAALRRRGADMTSDELAFRDGLAAQDELDRWHGAPNSM